MSNPVFKQTVSPRTDEQRSGFTARHIRGVSGAACATWWSSRPVGADLVALSHVQQQQQTSPHNECHGYSSL